MILSIGRDISERKEAEARLEQSNNKLVRRNEEIQYFYHTLSHELKTPLTSAKEFISLVEEGHAGKLNETQSEYLGIAHENCSHLAIYINDLLDMTRLDTGKLSLKRKPLDLGKLIQRVQTIMQAEADNKEIKLDIECANGLHKTLADKSRIMQVLINLYNNALKFTPAGGSIHTRLREDPEQPERVEISVTDTGCGIAEDQIDYLFRRYYQVDLNRCKASRRLWPGFVPLPGIDEITRRRYLRGKRTGQG